MYIYICISWVNFITTSLFSLTIIIVNKGESSPNTQRSALPLIRLSRMVIIPPFLWVAAMGIQLGILWKNGDSLPIFTNLYQSLPIFTNLYQSLPIFTNLHQSLPIFTNLYQSLPIFTNLNQSLPIPMIGQLIGQLIDSHGELPDRKTQLKLTRNPIRF